jgi:ABC-type microcin C transport system permease subunit YejE
VKLVGKHHKSNLNMGENLWNRVNYIRAVSVIIGLRPASVSSIITGLVTAYMGYLLYKVGTEASRYLETSSDDAIESLLEHFAKYLLISGILLIFTIVTTVFGLFVILQGIDGSY